MPPVDDNLNPGNEDVDQLYEQINAPTDSEIKMSSEEQATATASPEFTFTANGKEIKATKDEVLKWASQGHDYSQKMQSFKQEKEQLGDLSRYQEIDKYAKENPEWFEHVQNEYNSKANASDDSFTGEDQDTDLFEDSEHVDPEIQAIKEKTDKFDKFIDEFTAKENAKIRGEEDKLLDFEVKSIKEQYPKLDWDSPDESGHALEARVLQHAQDNGIAKFKTAFRDYMHDNLIKDAREEGKELVSQDIASKTKLGLLGTSSTPTKGLQQSANIKDKSYDDLMAEGLAELQA